MRVLSRYRSFEQPDAVPGREGKGRVSSQELKVILEQAQSRPETRVALFRQLVLQTLNEVREKLGESKPAP